jgi:hypothetical protein
MNQLFNLTTTQAIEICNGLERDLGSKNWCLSNVDFDESGTKLVQRNRTGYRLLSFDVSDDQLKVIHDHYEIDPDLERDLTIESMFLRPNDRFNGRQS